MYDPPQPAMDARPGSSLCMDSTSFSLMMSDGGQWAYNEYGFLAHEVVYCQNARLAPTLAYVALGGSCSDGAKKKKKPGCVIWTAHTLLPDRDRDTSFEPMIGMPQVRRERQKTSNTPPSFSRPRQGAEYENELQKNKDKRFFIRT